MIAPSPLIGEKVFQNAARAWLLNENFGPDLTVIRTTLVKRTHLGGPV